MKTLIILNLIVWGAWASMAKADDVLMRDGVTCDIPEAYNAAPHGPTNVFGMGDFCEFPLRDYLAGKAEQEAAECDAQTLVYPICSDDELVLSPSTQSYPCYELRTE